MSMSTDSSSSETDDSSSSETEDSSSFGTEDEEGDIDDPIEASEPILTSNYLEKDGTPETSQESSVERKADENETTSEDQDPAVLERALSQLKRVGWTGTIESFGVYQAKLLTKKRTKKTHAERVKNQTPEEREKRLSKQREQSKQKWETTKTTETPEEREKRLEKLRKWRLIREAKRSEDEKKKISERIRKRVALKKANETLEQREKRNASFREYQRKRDAKQPRPRKQLTETERATLLEKRKVRYYLRKASETPEEREERLAKVRAYEKRKSRRTLSPESLEKLNARRRELYRKKKLKKKPSSTTKQNWDVKIEAVESPVLEMLTENHSLHLEVAIEPNDLQETLLTYVKEEVIDPTWVESSVTDIQALTSGLLTSQQGNRSRHLTEIHQTEAPLSRTPPDRKTL